MWATVRFLVILLIRYFWHSVQIDFILAYPQADVECALYMHIPKGFAIAKHMFSRYRRICTGKQAGRVWKQHLQKALKKLVWIKNNVDECLY
jgi:Reverse transcriptase (RNA-dependent DNA polymerase)